MRHLIARLLTMQASRLLRRVRPHVIVVAGSIGKTSTTQAVSTVLAESFKVRKTYGNYNTDIGVPCSLFERRIPRALANPFSWLLLFLKNEITLVRERRAPSFNVAVLELGTDTVGELKQFEWLEPEIAILTAIAPEHMEAFKTIDAVADEELSVFTFAKVGLVNGMQVSESYRTHINIPFEVYVQDAVKEIIPDNSLHVHGVHSLDAVSAAISTARYLKMPPEKIIDGVKSIKPQAGRMNILNGMHHSVLIDDTYNSSPEAVKAALLYLTEQRTEPLKIALLGNMNELGETSARAHKEIGKLCDPKKINLVITLGTDANAYTAQVARKNGCEVVETNSPYEAASHIRAFLEQHKQKAVVLCKGSQNGVFAEEAVKQLLKNPADSKELVRQSDAWLKKKRENFGGRP